MRGRGQRASLPSTVRRTQRGRLPGHDGRLVVRCFSQDGEEHRDFDLSVLKMAPALKDALADAFVKRTAPGLTWRRCTQSTRSIERCFGLTNTWRPSPGRPLSPDT